MSLVSILKTYQRHFLFKLQLDLPVGLMRDSIDLHSLIGACSLLLCYIGFDLQIKVGYLLIRFHTGITEAFSGRSRGL